MSHTAGSLKPRRGKLTFNYTHILITAITFSPLTSRVLDGEGTDIILLKMAKKRFAIHLLNWQNVAGIA